MTRLTPLVLLLLCGCLSRSHVTPEPSPDDKHLTGHAAVAEQVGRDYLKRLAAVSRDVSAKADSLKSNAEVFDLVQRDSGIALKAAFLPLSDAENKLVQPDGEYDAAAVRAMLDAEAEGFEAAAGGAK